MKSLYIYPITKRNLTEVTNPYIGNLADSLSMYYNVVNRGHPTNRGIVDLLKYIHKIDILYLNWIEDLPGKYLGYLQTFLLFCMLIYLRLAGKVVLWTLHNKKPHSRSHSFLKGLIFRYLLKNSTAIITHAREGLKIIPFNTRKEYFPHPVKGWQIKNLVSFDKSYDIIIWGTITPYKGIDTFLSFLIDSDRIGEYQILIAGKITNEVISKYLHGISKQYSNITLIDRFIEESDLEKFIQSSKVVLFSYMPETVLSSGALMDSIMYDVEIVGPDTGAFRDMQEFGLVHTYKDHAQLIEILENLLSENSDESLRHERLKDFAQQNTWSAFAANVNKLIEDLK